MVLVQWQFIFNGTYSWAWQKQWYLISALTKTMVHNHGYYGTKSWLVWVLISASMVPVQWQFIFNGTYSWAWQNQWYLIMATMVLNLLWILIMAPPTPDSEMWIVFGAAKFCIRLIFGLNPSIKFWKDMWKFLLTSNIFQISNLQVK